MTEMLVAKTTDVAHAVVGMPDAFLRCRDTGHNWFQYRVLRVRTGFERDLFCRSCKASKHMMISRRGEILNARYNYVPGYQLHGIGRLIASGRWVMRLEALERTVANGNVDLGQPEGDL